MSPAAASAPAPAASAYSPHADAYKLTPTYHEVVIVGGGVSSIGMTIQLEQKIGVTDVLILEKESGLAGTWHVNSYPGCACDIPAALYSYSFAQNPYWSKMHPGVGELKQYFQDVAERYHVSPRARLHTVVLESRFDDATGLWHFIAQDVHTGGDANPAKYHYVSKIFVMAVGGLSEPNRIDIPGHEKFDGPIFHSQRWDHSVDLKNKDVVVVGNGCTAAQLIPIVRQQAKSLTQFARSKHWIAPVPQNPLEDYIPGWKWLIRHVPPVMWLNRALIFFVAEFTFNLVKLGKLGDLLRALWKRHCIKHVHRLAPKKYWDTLIPTDQEVVVGCKRRIFDNDYLASLNAPNIELIPENLRLIGKDYVQTKDGRQIHADVIIMCTGFSMLRAGFPMFIYGRNGEEMHEHWATYGRGANFAYRSSMQANFPNMGILMGANSATGHTSYVPLSGERKQPAAAREHHPLTNRFFLFSSLLCLQCHLHVGIAVPVPDRGVQADCLGAGADVARDQALAACANTGARGRACAAGQAGAHGGGDERGGAERPELGVQEDDADGVQPGLRRMVQGPAGGARDGDAPGQPAGAADTADVPELGGPGVPQPARARGGAVDDAVVEVVREPAAGARRAADGGQGRPGDCVRAAVRVTCGGGGGAQGQVSRGRAW